MNREIAEMQKSIDDFIKSHGIDNAIEQIRECLETPKNGNERLKKYLKGDFTGHEYISEKHDILCCLAKALKCYPKPIPTENIDSNTDTYQYDPAKNGQNILKHNLSFNQICSFIGNRGVLIVHTATKKTEKKDREPRLVYFLGIEDRKNDEGRKNDEDTENKNKNIKNVMAICAGNTSSLRFISARYFSNKKEEIEDVLKSTIKDEKLSANCLGDLRKSAYSLLEKYGYTEKCE